MEEGNTFDNFEAFKNALHQYEEKTFTKFVLVKSEKIRTTDTLFERFQYVVLRYQCKQGHRTKEKSSNQERPKQRSYKKGCPVQLNVRLNRPQQKEPFLRITKFITEHSGHDATKEVYSTYPEQRRIVVDEVDMTVLTSVTMSTSEQRDILETRHSGCVMRQDVYNLQKQLGIGSGSGGSDDVKCEAFVRDIISMGGHGEVGQDQSGHFRYLTVMTQAMKGLLEDYPECLVMDATYKVNNYLYPLLTIMVIDGEGHGMPVFHAFLAKEDRCILEDCLRIFARQFNADGVCCFIVDKDMSEIAALGSVFPGVPINLCQFHISQAVERYLKKELKGVSQSAVIKVVLDSFMSQVNTESELEFEEIRVQISQIVPQSVVDYFVENWWSKPHLWAACCNLNVARFHATTTNTLESYHSKIKRFINEKLSLSAVLSSLISFDSAKIKESQRMQIVAANSDVYDHRDRDLVCQAITSSMTRFGAELVKRELYLSRHTDYSVSSDSGRYVVMYRDKQYTVSQTTCTCSTYGHLRVPCRHIFFLRNHQSLVIFDADEVPERFKQTPVVFNLPSSVADDLPISTVPVVPLSLRTVEGRYKRAKVVCDKAASFLSILGVAEFQHKLHELEEFLSRWSGVEVDSSPVDTEDYTVVPVDSVSAVDGSVVAVLDSIPFVGPDSVDLDSIPAVGDSVPAIAVAPDFSGSLVVGRDSASSLVDDVPSWPKMSRLLKPRGRPGSRQRFTLSAKRGQKRRRDIPKAYSSLSDDDKVSIALGAVSLHSSKPSCLITRDEVKHYVDFADTIIDDRVDITCIREFFEPSAWDLVEDGVGTRRLEQIFFCGTCKEVDDGELKLVQCERCLKWHHFECVSYSSKKTVLVWFCEKCL